MSQRKFIGDIALIQLLNWLIKPIWIFAIDRYVQNTLGDIVYGKYYIAFNIGLLFSFLLDIGINNFITVNYAQNKIFKLKKIITLKLVLSIAYLLVAIGFGISQHLPVALLIFVILNQFLLSWILFFRSILQGLQRAKIDAIFSVLDKFLAIIICFFFISQQYFKTETGIVFFSIAQFIALIFSVILFFFVISKKPIPYNYSFQNKTNTIIKDGLPFALLALTMLAFTRIDSLMIYWLLNNESEQVGAYAKSFRLLDAALIFSTLISTILLPTFGKIISEKKDLNNITWLALRIIFLVGIFTVLSCIFYSTEIMQLLYNTSSNNNTFAIVMGCFLPMAIVHIFGTLLTAAKKIYLLIYISIACILINVVGNLICIPTIGITGAGIICLVTQSIFGVLCMYFSVKKLNIKIGLIQSAKLCIFASLITAVYFIFKTIYIPFIAELVIICIVFFTLIFVTKIVSINEIKKLRLNA